MNEAGEDIASGSNPAKRPPRALAGVICWALIHLLVTGYVLRGANSLYMLAIYGGLSWLIALPVVALVVKTSYDKYRLLGLWIIGPFLLYVYAKAGAAYSHYQFNQTMAEVRELCDKYGSEKIYRTVDNVEGVFQIVARDPSEAAMQDRNAENPWATAQGDRAEMREYATSLVGYRFFEQQPGYKQEGPPFKRTYLRCRSDEQNPTGSTEKCEPIQAQRSVDRLQSRYGYLIEDRTTPEMRAKWIGGGTIRIIELESKEVLAERTGYYKAVGGSAKLHWGDVRASWKLCKFEFGLIPFLTTVLRPVETPPTAGELEHLDEG